MVVDKPGRAAPGDKPHFHGHGERLRGRLVKTASEALANYEMMELVLFLGRPRGNMKPLAKRQIDHFGGFGETISTQPAPLREVNGVGKATISASKVFKAAAVRLSRSHVTNRSTLSSWTALLDYGIPPGPNCGAHASMKIDNPMTAIVPGHFRCTICGNSPEIERSYSVISGIPVGSTPS